MLAMENSSRYGRASQPHSSFKQRRSGYEPSDTESDWQESPWHEKNGALAAERLKSVSDAARNTSPLRHSQRHPSKLDYDLSSPFRASQTSPVRRRSSKSPYKPRRDDGNVVALSPKTSSNVQRNISPFSKSERRRHISPYKTWREEADTDNDEFIGSNRRQNNGFHGKHLDPEGNEAHPSLVEASRVGEKPAYSRRSVTAPRPRPREKEQPINFGLTQQRGDQSPSPFSRSLMRKQSEVSNGKGPSASELNEMVANAKLSRDPNSDALKLESTDSILPGDIFFSRDYTALDLKKNMTNLASKPKIISGRDTTFDQRNQQNGNFNQNAQVVSSSAVLSRTTTTSSSAASRQSMGKISIESSKMSDGTGRMSESFQKFAANRQKSQTNKWFGCVRKGSCRTSKSPETTDFDEASFIERAFVVENLRQFWADKHQPRSLHGFTCHKQQAQLLKQLISHQNCPHILFKGPSGSGKKALTMALLHEIYGDPAWSISHELRYFHIQEKRPIQVVLPVTSSPHHVALNLSSESKNIRYALMALVKEITSSHAITPEVSTADFKANYKVIVLYEVDKITEDIQHLIKWIMDCYTDACKIILCCEDDMDILESVKSRCKVISVDPPVTHEIMEVLIQIARKENFDLSMSFAAKIATKSKQNLRKAIMALEACKAHNYPFVDEQPIPLGWEEVLVELAVEILSDPSPSRLFFIRGKFQKLLVDFVHPKLILQKLVEQFLKGVDANLKRELYYWHAYYAKRLPEGTSALLKLEEFVAKFMSIYRKSIGSRRNC